MQVVHSLTELCAENSSLLYFLKYTDESFEGVSQSIMAATPKTMNWMMLEASVELKMNIRVGDNPFTHYR